MAPSCQGSKLTKSDAPPAGEEHKAKLQEDLESHREHLPTRDKTLIGLRVLSSRSEVGSYRQDQLTELRLSRLIQGRLQFIMES